MNDLNNMKTLPTDQSGLNKKKKTKNFFIV